MKKFSRRIEEGDLTFEFDAACPEVPEGFAGFDLVGRAFLRGRRVASLRAFVLTPDLLQSNHHLRRRHYLTAYEAILGGCSATVTRLVILSNIRTCTDVRRRRIASRLLQSLFGWTEWIDEKTACLLFVAADEDDPDAPSLAALVEFHAALGFTRLNVPGVEENFMFRPRPFGDDSHGPSTGDPLSPCDGASRQRRCNCRSSLGRELWRRCVALHHDLGGL